MKLRVMYKIIILQEMVSTKLLFFFFFFFFHKTDRKSINSDLLFYTGRAVRLWEGWDEDWLQLFSVLQLYIIAGVCVCVCVCLFVCV